MDVETKYNIGDIVFLMTDTDQMSRIVTGILLRPNKLVLYYLTSGTNETIHYDFEIVQVKNYAL